MNNIFVPPKTINSCANNQNINSSISNHQYTHHNSDTYLCNYNITCYDSDTTSRSITKNNYFGFYQNCRGLRTKLSTVKRNVASYDYIFIALTETWLNINIFDNELGMIKYNVSRCDRYMVTNNSSRGGGVLVAIRNDIPSYVLPVVTPVIDTFMNHLLLKLKD